MNDPNFPFPPWLYVIMVVLLCATVINAWYQMIRILRNPERVEWGIAQFMQTLGRGDRDLSRSYVRGIMPAASGATVMCSGGLLVIILPNPDDFGFGFVWIIVAMVLSIFLVILIVQFNLPKFLVPPHMRADPGFWQVKRLRVRGVDVDALYEASAEQWRERRDRRRHEGP
ncbi:hypothetical protein ACQEVI_24055 [Promicromonospora sp. CA-289599]|uniref:hypothetical protein n=1 Tax=Promicromonospora sp. CA-289599 TaxID=3240014 RepID=UPI003D8C14E6